MHYEDLTGWHEVEALPSSSSDLPHEGQVYAVIERHDGTRKVLTQTSPMFRPTVGTAAKLGSDWSWTVTEVVNRGANVPGCPDGLERRRV